MSDQLTTQIEVPQPPGPVTAFSSAAHAECAARNAYLETLNAERKTRTVYLVTQMEHSEEHDAYRDNPMFKAGRLAILDASYNTRSAYAGFIRAAEFSDEQYARALAQRETN